MSASGDFGPAPAGVDLGENQNGDIFGPVVALMVVSSIFIITRFVTRIVGRTGGVSLDDYLIVVGWIFTTGTAMCCLISTNYGCGRHLWVLTTTEFEAIFKILYSYVYLYASGVTFTKLSILAFYRRVFGVTQAFWVCLALVCGYWVAIMIAWINVCRPVNLFWYRYTTDNPGYCFNDSKFYFGNGIANMLIDCCILAYPVPIVWKLQMPLSKKLAVIGILMLGSFVCVASIVRLVNLNDLIHSTDTTWTMGPVFVWSCVEPYVGIICACLPTLAPIVRVVWNKIRGKSLNYHSQDEHDRKATGGVSANMRSSQKGSNWNRLGDSTNRLRNDDEVELTNDITGPGGVGRGRSAMGLGIGTATSKSSDEDLVYGHGGIMVKNDVQWSTGEVDVKEGNF